MQRFNWLGLFLLALLIASSEVAVSRDESDSDESLIVLRGGLKVHAHRELVGNMRVFTLLFLVKEKGEVVDSISVVLRKKDSAFACDFNLAPMSSPPAQVDKAFKLILSEDFLSRSVATISLVSEAGEREEVEFSLNSLINDVGPDER